MPETGTGVSVVGYEIEGVGEGFDWYFDPKDAEGCAAFHRERPGAKIDTFTHWTARPEPGSPRRAWYTIEEKAVIAAIDAEAKAQVLARRVLRTVEGYARGPGETGNHEQGGQGRRGDG